MSTEFDFLVMDANQAIEAQQSVARELISSKIALASFSAAASHAELSASSRSPRSPRPLPTLS
jgi:hypothetical protein